MARIPAAASFQVFSKGLTAMRIASIFSSLACVLALSAAGCSSSSGPSLDPAKSNCKVVCNKAHDCINTSSDADKCATDCDGKSDGDTSYKDKIQTCSDCLEPLACGDIAKCGSDCFPAAVAK